MAAPSLPAGYRFLDGAPTVDDYLRLRREAGLSPRRRDQVTVGLAGSWAAVHVTHRDDGTVAMGRAIGDGGCNFHLLDLAVLPAHQRRGLGDAILTELLARIRAAAPPGAHVDLLADPPGRALYARHGFVPTSPRSVGMALSLDRALPG